ncbi:ornithine cyclodeaminase [Rhodoferax aquaticus]|uniref:Ornithine cyclodeaminase n=1 Tax=Rhodoferax aquaticus TaxID=2527691 RepID=A0A515EKY2_9BURK|nr:ornithine cyclodeaminase [Rhodoferax aquaticus]QDL53318.1 ornithine cyclodeaminase [Rhodoferax aquaticus]
MTQIQNLKTQFLSVEDVARLVGEIGIASTLQRMANYIEQDYIRWQDFDKCARVAAHSPEGVIELMPIADAKTYTFKYVNGHPKNTAAGLPTVMAFGVLADVDTGAPLLLSELTLTTALRTAAMSAVAARVLARPNSKSMALIGNGAQSEFQALAFHYLLGIEELRLYDTDPAATAKLVANLAHTKLRITVASSIAQAVKGADIVTTVTADKTNATILSADMLEPGMHINGVGGDCPGKTELHPDVLRASTVFVQYEPQTRIEGDLQHLPADFAVTELWQVLALKAKGRTSAQEITLFDSVGFALEDFSALRFLHEAAQAQGVGQTISLVPQLANPKDLFSALRPAAPLSASQVLAQQAVQALALAT